MVVWIISDGLLADKHDMSHGETSTQLPLEFRRSLSVDELGRFLQAVAAIVVAVAITVAIGGLAFAMMHAAKWPSWVTWSLTLGVGTIALFVMGSHCLRQYRADISACIVFDQRAIKIRWESQNCEHRYADLIGLAPRMHMDKHTTPGSDCLFRFGDGQSYTIPRDMISYERAESIIREHGRAWLDQLNARLARGESIHIRNRVWLWLACVVGGLICFAGGCMAINAGVRGGGMLLAVAAVLFGAGHYSKGRGCVITNKGIQTAFRHDAEVVPWSTIRLLAKDARGVQLQVGNRNLRLSAYAKGYDEIAVWLPELMDCQQVHVGRMAA